MTSQPTTDEIPAAAAARAELVAFLIDEILSQWMTAESILNEKNKADSELFSPLQFIHIDEKTHSALVGELLKPRGSHGQGRLFLDSFLALVDVHEPTAGDEWAVTVEKMGRIDILLCRSNPSSVVIIENKSNRANDQLNQLYRYWYYRIHLPHLPMDLDYDSEDTKRRFKIVYLTPDSYKKPVDHSLDRPQDLPPELPKRIPIEPFILPFQDLIQTWRDDPAVKTTNERLKVFLDFYSDCWQSL